MSELLNSLNRLERVGSDLSGASQKLIVAATVVASEVGGRLGSMAKSRGGIALPRGYYISRGPQKGDKGFMLCWAKSPRSQAHIMAIDSVWTAAVEARISRLKELKASEKVIAIKTCGDLPTIYIATARRLADDIAGGWLPEIEEALKKEANDIAAGTEVLDNARKSLGTE